jgi:hypothetical protein
MRPPPVEIRRISLSAPVSTAYFGVAGVAVTAGVAEGVVNGVWVEFEQAAAIKQMPASRSWRMGVSVS